MTVEAIRSGIDLSHVDSDARPQDDLFGHVNGRWLTDYEIPADRATDGAFRPLFDRAEEQVRDLITGAARRRHRAAARHQRHRRAAHRRSVRQLHGREARWPNAACSRCWTSWPPSTRGRTPTRLAAVLGALQRTGVGGGTGVYVDTDSKNSTRYLLHLSQSGLGLPDESYYRDEQHAEILAAYPRHIAAMFALVYGGEARSRRDGRADRRAGDQARRRALGRRQAPRRRPDLQPAHVRRPARRGAGIRLGRLGDRAGHHARGRGGSRCAPTGLPDRVRRGVVG